MSATHLIDRLFVSLVVGAVTVSAVTFAGSASAQETGLSAKKSERIVARSRGADGAIDSVRTGPAGRSAALDRSKDASGTTDARITGPGGGVTLVDRSRGADGALDKTVVGPQGQAKTVDRAVGADGAVDKTVPGPRGGSRVIDRSRASESVSKTITVSPPTSPQ